MKKFKQAFGMVDVSAKMPTQRVAIAQGTVQMSKSTYNVLLKKGSPKGNVLETARTAGIMAAKQTSSILPLCHPLSISYVNLKFQFIAKKRCVEITATVGYFGQTGVEMEALTAVSVAALTIYDMMKWSDKAIEISGIQLLHKSGGKSGTYTSSQK